VYLQILIHLWNNLVEFMYLCPSMNKKRNTNHIDMHLFTLKVFYYILEYDNERI